MSLRSDSKEEGREERWSAITTSGALEEVRGMPHEVTLEPWTGQRGIIHLIHTLILMFNAR